MSQLTHITYIRQLLDRHGFTFNKRLGQNFLINPSVCPRMAELGGAGPGVGVLEIGPGIGVLTRELCSLADKVVAVELDARLIPVLGETMAAFKNLKVINGDIMEVDIHSLIEDEFSDCREVVICANLPYYITSPVITRILESRLAIKSLTVMVQKEAARRLAARPGVRECGAISAAIWYYSEPRLLFSVSPGSFIPAPNVESAVVRMDVLKAPPVAVEDERAFFTAVRAAFAQRRKTILNSLSSALAVPKADVSDAISAAGLAPAARAESLTLEQLARLADALYRLGAI